MSVGEVIDEKIKILSNLFQYEPSNTDYGLHINNCICARHEVQMIERQLYKQK